MKKILIDEFPCNKDVLYANDYNGKIIYRLLGTPLLSINDKSIQNSQLNITIEGNNLYIRANNDEEKNILNETIRKLDDIYEGWKGCYKVFFIGIKKHILENEEKYMKFVMEGLL